MTVASDAAPYAPRPGTVAFRALALLERRGELSASQIAEELGMLASGGIAPHLEAPLRHGLVERRRRDPHSRAPYWYRLVPAAAAPEASPPEPPSERALSAPSVSTADDAPPPAVSIRLAPVEKPEVDSDSQSVRMASPSARAPLIGANVTVSMSGEIAVVAECGTVILFKPARARELVSFLSGVTRA